MKTRRVREGSQDGDAQRAAAASLAVAALGFLAAEPERIGRFLALTGIGPDEIRTAAARPEFLAGVLDHIASDENLLLEFAAQEQIKPAAIMRAATTLGGGLWERDIP